MLKSERAISTILATLLLIVISVVAVVITYAWITIFTGSTTGQAGVFLERENVYWNSTGAKTIVIDVRNSGVSDAEINAVYVGTSSTSLILQSYVEYDPSTKLVSAYGGKITITVTYNWATDIIYYFRIAPKVGTVLEFNLRSPS